MIVNFSPDKLRNIIDQLTFPYGKVWPLHIFNACNPLVAYESLAFTSALQKANEDLEFSYESAFTVFQRLFEQGVFTKEDIEHVISIDSDLQINKELNLGIGTFQYKSIAQQEILMLLDSKTSTTEEVRYTSLDVKKIEEKISYSLHQEAGLHNPIISHRNWAWINEQTSKWLSAYLDDGQAIWGMPNRDIPLRYAWTDLAQHDFQLSKTTRKNLSKLISLCIQSNFSSVESIATLLELKLNDSTTLESILKVHLKQMPGWVGYIHYVQSVMPEKSDLLYDFILLRLLYQFSCPGFFEEPMDSSVGVSFSSVGIESLAKRILRLSQNGLFPAMSSEDSLEVVFNNINQWDDYWQTYPMHKLLSLCMEALEFAQNQPLITTLNEEFAQNSRLSVQIMQSEPDAQVIFCIDVRSEPFRKALESVSNIQTYGFAGFFGLPISKKTYGSVESISMCPILLEPEYIIEEDASPFSKNNLISSLLRQAIPFKEQWIYSLKKIKRDTIATFSYVESLGFIHGLTFLRDSFISVPFGRLKQKMQSAISPWLGLSPKLEFKKEPGAIGTGIPIANQVELAKNIFTLMGLSEPYAEFIILCGHASQTYNNPYASSLDCGACGSNGGGFNASVLCQMLNNPDIREALMIQGIVITEHTKFIAAEHNTTTDEVYFLNLDLIPNHQQQRFMSIQKSFEKATRINQRSRQLKLLEHSKVSHKEDSFLPSLDWSQTRPEWGLSKNQAFVIANREHIKDIDFQGRAFLHSYDWLADSEGDILTVIMTAPMVVGAWINLQYCFSTLDQERFGSGKKYIHNVVGLFGTYIGNSSDLRLGLPYESLFSNDGSPYHYPQRLLVYIQSPLERVAYIIEKNEAVAHLVRNNWINMVVFDPITRLSYRYLKGTWQNFQNQLLASSV